MMLQEFHRHIHKKTEFFFNILFKVMNYKRIMK